MPFSPDWTPRALAIRPGSHISRFTMQRCEAPVPQGRSPPPKDCAPKTARFFYKEPLILGTAFDRATNRPLGHGVQGCATDRIAATAAGGQHGVYVNGGRRHCRHDTCALDPNQRA